MIWLTLLLFLSGSVCLEAQQNQIPNYRTARSQFFWAQLYRDGGESLYCSRAFVTSHSGLNIEHVLPASGMKKAAGCETQSRKNCRRNSQKFNFMEGDLHNLYPSIIEVNSKRGSLPFGEVPGEASDFPPCDFEARDGKVEPRPEARGEVARSVFYMIDAYGVEIDETQLAVLMQWHKDDPPSDHERFRNERIEDLQGTRNAYIDDPSLIPGEDPEVDPIDQTSESILLHYICECKCGPRRVFVQVPLESCSGQSGGVCEIVSDGGTVERRRLTECTPLMTNRQ